jgi:hypothetical protein
MSLSTILTRFVICIRHGHDWVRAHRRDGSSYMRCQGCREVRS